MQFVKSLKYLEFSSTTITKFLKDLEFSSATRAKSLKEAVADPWLTLITKEHGVYMQTSVSKKNN